MVFSRQGGLYISDPQLLGVLEANEPCGLCLGPGAHVSHHEPHEPGMAEQLADDQRNVMNGRTKKHVCLGCFLWCFCDVVCDVRVRLDYGTKTRRTHQFR